MKALLVLALALAPLTLAAQEVATADVSDDTGIPASDLSVIERWQADPAQVFDAAEVTLSELLFVARPVVVFADSPSDPRFTEQLALLAADVTGLVARDVIVIADSDPAAQSDARARLRPRGFGLVVIGKDGRVAQRKPAPWSVREIVRAIDKLPLRQQEIREGR